MSQAALEKGTALRSWMTLYELESRGQQWPRAVDVRGCLALVLL